MPNPSPRSIAARPARLALLVGLAALPIAACTDDPFERPGTWRPAGVNEANLRAQVVDPAMLERGVGASTDRGQQGSMPITTLQDGKRPAVPTTRLTGVGFAGSAGSVR